MRIRRLLKIATVVGIASVLIVAATISALLVLDAQHSQEARRLDEAVRKVSMLRSLQPDFSHAPNPRATRQWQAVYAELTPVLGAMPALDPSSQDLKADIVKAQAGLAALFERLSPADQGSIAQDIRAFIGGELNVRSASMVSDILTLRDLTDRHIAREKQGMIAGVAASVAALAGVIMALMLIMYRRIAAPITKLEEATANLSAGYLDQPVAIPGRDEVAGLSRSFDRMRIALRDRLLDLGEAKARLQDANANLERRVLERTRQLEEANGILTEQSAALLRKTGELEESEAQYRAMGEAVPYGVWLCDARGGARYFSQSFLDLQEMTLEEMQGFGWTKRYAPGEVDAMMDGWMHCIDTGEPWEYELRILGSDGEYRTILSRGRPVRDGRGTITSWAGVNLDITDRKRAEVEVAGKKAELELALIQIKALDESKNRFFANVSHELRTPLALILGPVDELLAEPATPPDCRRDLEVVRRNAQTLLTYVNDLLDLSRLDAGHLVLDYSEADLARIVGFVTDHFAWATSQRGIDLRVTAPASLAAQVDSAKVGRVLFNLVSNAFKHVSDGSGWIAVALGAEDGHAVITITDNGPGIPVAMRERIFQRFVQGDDPQRSAGTGLGLAIAWEFVSQHGGSMAVEDAPGGGALFRVVLPLAAPEGTRIGTAGSIPGDPGMAAMRAPEPEPEPEAEAEPGGAASEAGLPVVLVVEDNPDLRTFIARTLKGVARVATARDGVEGLATAERLRPDLVLTDIMMPRMSGDRMVAALRAQAELADIPIMVLSARADEPLRTRLLRGQAQDYLVKPFTPDELQARVANLLHIKRARDFLQAEVASRHESLEELAHELAVINRKLRRTADAMAVARDEAEAASKAKSAFLNMVSHELRTPLTQLELQLALLQRRFRGAFDAEQDQILVGLAAALRRLTHMVGSVLEYSRIESGRLTIHPERFDLAELVSAACTDVREEAKQRGLDLVFEADGDVPPLMSDPVLVRVILHNLLDNAIKYTPQGRVSARTSGRDGLLRIEVADTGLGIPAELQRKIFEPFEHLESVDRKHAPGVGLGLALVKEIVASLDGRVSVTSASGQGSTFTVELPSREEEPDAYQPRSRSASALEAAADKAHE